jgi:hypothetical protein
MTGSERGITQDALVRVHDTRRIENLLDLLHGFNARVLLGIADVRSLHQPQTVFG